MHYRMFQSGSDKILHMVCTNNKSYSFLTLSLFHVIVRIRKIFCCLPSSKPNYSLPSLVSVSMACPHGSRTKQYILNRSTSVQYFILYNALCRAWQRQSLSIFFLNKKFIIFYILLHDFDSLMAKTKKKHLHQTTLEEMNSSYGGFPAKTIHVS